jgi:hypothetical protein
MNTDSRLSFLETFKTIDRDIPWVFYNVMGCFIQGVPIGWRCTNGVKNSALKFYVPDAAVPSRGYKSGWWRCILENLLALCSFNQLAGTLIANLEWLIASQLILL